MPRNDGGRFQTRMVHVRLSEDVHRQLRIRAAESDTTLQDWITMAIKNELGYREQKKYNNPE